MELTTNEIKMLEVIRELKPYEKIEIRKDRDGKVDKYTLNREQTIFYT